MNIKEQLEAARVLYYQALNLTSSLNNAAYQTQYKSGRHDRIERLILKNKVRIHLRFERILKLHDAYIAELGQKNASFKDSSLSDSTGLALSPAQPVEAVGQGATINEFPSLEQLNADFLTVGFFTHWGEEPIKEQIEDFTQRVNSFMFLGHNEHKSRVLAFDTIIDDRDGK
jgi:hypothetical protein